MAKLSVKGLPAGDAGRQIVRLNVEHRGGVSRYGVVELKNRANGKLVRVVVLGHDDTTAIFMPYDVRVGLGLDKGGQLDFEMSEVGWLGKLRWYVEAKDPAISIPAWIAVVGLLLAVGGFVVSFIFLR